MAFRCQLSVEVWDVLEVLISRNKYSILNTMFDQQTKCSKLSVLSSSEQRSDAVCVANIVFSSSLQQHLTDLQVISAGCLLKSCPSMIAACVHLCSRVQQSSNNGSITPFTGCEEESDLMLYQSSRPHCISLSNIRLSMLCSGACVHISFLIPL